MEKYGLQPSVAGTTEHPYAGTMNIDADLTSFTKINSRWSMDLNVKCKIIKHLDDNRGKNLDAIGVGINFLDKTSKILSMKEITDKGQGEKAYNCNWITIKILKKEISDKLDFVNN